MRSHFCSGIHGCTARSGEGLERKEGGCPPVSMVFEAAVAAKIDKWVNG